MTQVVSAIAVLGPGLTGLALGYRVLNLDATVYSAFTVVDVAETAVLGTYRVANGVIVPAVGGYIVFGTALVDYALAPVDEAPAVPGDAMTLTAAYDAAMTAAQVGEAAAAITAAGLATATNIDDLETHGDGAWATATGFAVPGSAMALTVGERTATAGVIWATLLEGAHTVADGLRIMLAALAGRSTGGGTFTNRFRDVGNTKNRIDSTVDANGNRNAITIDGTP